MCVFIVDRGLFVFGFWFGCAREEEKALRVLLLHTCYARMLSVNLLAYIVCSYAS